MTRRNNHLIAALTGQILDIQTGHCNNYSIKFNSNMASTVALEGTIPALNRMRRNLTYLVGSIHNQGFSSPNNGSVSVYAHVELYSYVFLTVQRVCRVLRQLLRCKLSGCCALKDPCPTIS
jgi:hypothetical protein